MSNAKLYFRASPQAGFPLNHDEMAYTLAQHRAELEPGETRTLYRARPVPTTHFFWCRHHQEAGATEDGGCGRECPAYAPRNGRNGRCRHHGPCYEADPEETLTITRD